MRAWKDGRASRMRASRMPRRPAGLGGRRGRGGSKGLPGRRALAGPWAGEGGSARDARRGRARRPGYNPHPPARVPTNLALGGALAVSSADSPSGGVTRRPSRRPNPLLNPRPRAPPADRPPLARGTALLRTGPVRPAGAGELRLDGAARDPDARGAPRRRRARPGALARARSTRSPLHT